ncbi:LacI family DNA-binding transcriptional regulator [Microbacterium saperdae]|uniref:LacI family transcriptional regulator n=1 Tax=Microbacterium saperdae TaxID=69368 RepID=A0A543BB08_9MICO|nr:LacI family DNA-binding transcriptional regulator [Microbacterium saperdae]TQL81923.1 LacI family transcriptional regulator [Microbacterium saperdae]GGM35780.1 transcriptional regulator [Microbacterium saperdae]
MITLKDLAAAVGVSASAVSLVLNDRDEGRVNADTARRIRAVAAEMGYIPNVLARGLRTRRTHTIGLLSDGVASIPFAGRMLEGVQTSAWDAGYLAMLIDTANRPELVAQSTKSLLQRDIEAMILAAEYHRVVPLPPIPPTIPVVILNGIPDDPAAADSVVPDEAGGASAAVRHLLEAGHTRIGFCTVSGDRFIASKLRFEGYRAALREHAVEYDAELVLELADPSTANAVEPLREFLSSARRPSALFCFSDQIAFAAYQVCADLGLSIPGDLSVIGFDDQEFIAEALRPGLTTVQLPHREMGAWAAKRAVDRIHGSAIGPPQSAQIRCPLIIRGSVTPHTS